MIIDAKQGQMPQIIKSDLFCMNFVNNPKNYLYAKLSRKNRANRVGADHSSAALLENAIGDDRVTSIKIGSRFSRLGENGPLFKNYVGKASTEIISGENTSLLKSKLFARLTHKPDKLPVYGQASLSLGHIARL